MSITVLLENADSWDHLRQSDIFDKGPGKSTFLIKHLHNFAASDSWTELLETLLRNSTNDYLILKVLLNLL